LEGGKDVDVAVQVVEVRPVERKEGVVELLKDEEREKEDRARFWEEGEGRVFDDSRQTSAKWASKSERGNFLKK
jgi:hypothetical protein